MEDSTLFESLGGRPLLERVHKIFYDKIYAHPWLKQFFKDVDQKIIESQQTDFMTSNMGGGKIYSGSFPKDAHKHMFISEELFQVRLQLLRDSLVECNVPEELIERWLRIDQAFKKSLVKDNVAECQKRFFTDEIKAYPKP